jgi:preprotein translocase subunit YajC
MQQYTTFIFIALLVLVFYFLILRPQRKRQQSIQQTMSALSPGNRVMLASGLFGTVVSVGPRQVVIEISPGAEVTVLKQAITKIVTDADEDNLEDQGEFEDEEPASAEPFEPDREPPIEEPPSATSTEPAAPKTSAEPDTPATRDSKPQAAD